ncbi:MAG: DUF1611 domain-containing protein [Planctomycetota bacterium]|nr:DUF1611 domain-containing protein [Planctomycetota bacterium]
MTRRFVILTEGHSNPITAKTAACVIRYRPAEVVALLDSTQRGQTSRELLGVGQVPVISSLEEVPDANHLLIGIAAPGGRIPPAWRSIILSAIQRGIHVVSGMHEFLADDPEFSRAAQQQNVKLWDVRNNRQQHIARGLGLREACLRILTVGHDCSCGKMVTAVEVSGALKRRGVDAKFGATGQTGIIVEGDGYPIDCMVADFVSGAAEQLVLDHQHHEVLLIEGQGSLAHPSFSGVTLSLLHGSQPHALILCYEAGRTAMHNLEHVPLPPLSKFKEWNEVLGGIGRPCPVIGISMNSRRLSSEAAEDERRRVRDEFGLPVCDVFRHGPDELAEAVLQLWQARCTTGSLPERA